METNDDTNFDTDLDDEDTGQNDNNTVPKLSFDEKLAAHRSNRLTEIFGQINISDECQSQREKEINNETLLSIPFKTSSSKNGVVVGRVQTYEKCCQVLDITSDWQIRGLLPYDNIVLSDRPFSYNDFRAFATAIQSNLESLTLNAVGLTSRSVFILCQGLKKCVRLTLLDLSNNKIGKRGFETLIETLDYLPSLLYLSLANCSIQDSYGLRIGDLCRHKNLIELNLSGNQLEDNGCIFIGNALTENTSLVYLNLSWNLIRSYASVALFRATEVNKYLTELDISWSGLSYDGSVALRRVLIVNKILQRLNISNCHVEWMSARLIGEGLRKNSTLQILNLSYNPITTHGVHYIIQAIDTKTSAVSLLDISGITVYSTSVRLAEKIAHKREFVMKYDCEVPVHDILGQQTVTKGDSMRKILQHIDERNWRTLEYFRMLDKKNNLALNRKNITLDILKSGVELDNEDIKTIHNRFTERAGEPLTYKHLNDIINEQRMRDRALKTLQEKQVKNMKKRNQKILQTVSHHFPNIEVISKYQKHKEAIEQLARPRALSAHPRT